MAHSDHRLPPWVDEAARRFERRGTPEIVDDWPKPPRIGDVRLAEPLDPARGEQRLVVVLDTDSQVASVRVALASNELQWRSEEGLVLPSASTEYACFPPCRR